MKRSKFVILIVVKSAGRRPLRVVFKRDHYFLKGEWSWLEKFPPNKPLHSKNGLKKEKVQIALSTIEVQYLMPKIFL